MILGYIRVSTEEQNTQSQKDAILRYAFERRLIVDDFIDVEVSSRKSVERRRITELLDQLKEGDTVIVSEISRLGRSIKEVLEIISTITNVKRCRLVAIKQGIDADPYNQTDVTTKVLITVFSLVAELERDFISERTKEGLRTQKAKGVRLGKPLGKIQKSIYDKDRDRILELYNLGVPLQGIITTHLKYGKYLSLSNYIKKRKNARPEDLPIYKSA